MERDILPSSLDSFQNVCKNIERWTLTLYFSNLISFSLQFFGCFLFHFFLSHSIFINSSLLTLATTFQAPPFIYLFFWCWKIQVLTLHNYLRLLFFFFLANFLIRFFPFSIPSSSYSSWVACFLSAPQILFKSLSLSLSSSISLPLSHILINPSCYLSCPPNPHDYIWMIKGKEKNPHHPHHDDIVPNPNFCVHTSTCPFLLPKTSHVFLPIHSPPKCQILLLIHNHTRNQDNIMQYGIIKWKEAHTYTNHQSSSPPTHQHGQF